MSLGCWEREVVLRRAKFSWKYLHQRWTESLQTRTRKFVSSRATRGISVVFVAWVVVENKVRFEKVNSKNENLKTREGYTSSEHSNKSEIAPPEVVSSVVLSLLFLSEFSFGFLLTRQGGLTESFLSRRNRQKLLVSSVPPSFRNLLRQSRSPESPFTRHSLLPVFSLLVRVSPYFDGVSLLSSEPPPISLYPSVPTYSRNLRFSPLWSMSLCRSFQSLHLSFLPLSPTYVV